MKPQVLVYWAHSIINRGELCALVKAVLCSVNRKKKIHPSVYSARIVQVKKVTPAYFLSLSILTNKWTLE